MVKIAESSRRAFQKVAASSPGERGQGKEAAVSLDLRG